MLEAETRIRAPKYCLVNFAYLLSWVVDACAYHDQLAELAVAVAVAVIAYIVVKPGVFCWLVAAIGALV